MKNAINWFSIPVANYQRAKDFYESMLEIKMQDIEMAEQKMAFFPVEDMGIGGSLNLSDEFSPLTNVSIYLNTNDLEKSLDKVEKSGGSVLMPKTQISPEFGYFGMIQDSEGNKVGLHSYD